MWNGLYILYLHIYRCSENGDVDTTAKTAIWLDQITPVPSDDYLIALKIRCAY